MTFEEALLKANMSELYNTDQLYNLLRPYNLTHHHSLVINAVLCYLMGDFESSTHMKNYIIAHIKQQEWEVKVKDVLGE